MTDNLALRGLPDSQKININQPWEIRRWTKNLGTTERELRSAVSYVGPITTDVRKFLDWKRLLRRRKLLRNNAHSSKIVLLRQRNGSYPRLLVYVQRPNRLLFNHYRNLL
jgi:hypothetical protein